MKAKFSYGSNINSGVIQHISEVPNGLKCECQCVECKGNLIAANQGEKQIPHFRHQNITNCKGGQESAIHEYAKQIVQEANSILLEKGNYFDYQSSSIEEPFHDIQPDVIIRNSNNEIWIVEIAVTHFIDKIKNSKIHEKKINCIEIDLSKEPRDIEPNALKKIVLDDHLKRSIIYPTASKRQHNKGCSIGWIFGVASIIFLLDRLYKSYKRRMKL